MSISTWGRIKRAFGVPTEPERAARVAFAADNPKKKIVWTTLAADEGSRFVVGVFYAWGGVPPRFVFYAVSKDGLRAAPLEDDSPYRPKVWR